MGEKTDGNRFEAVQIALSCGVQGSLYSGFVRLDADTVKFCWK